MFCQKEGMKREEVILIIIDNGERNYIYLCV